MPWPTSALFPTASRPTHRPTSTCFPIGATSSSVGKAVWKNQCRNLSDPVIRQEAVDNWPKMYVDQRQKIGDDVLPSADLLDLIPYAVLSDDRNSIEFRLLTLGADKATRLLKGDDINISKEWTTLQYQPPAGDTTPLPAWKRMAYWSDSIVVLDDQANSWDIQPNFQGAAYTSATRCR
jgi:hypothetical protein